MFKKRTLSVLMLILFALSLTGCTFHIVNNFGYGERHFTLELYNDCKSDIYGYRVEYMLDGKPVGGTVGSNADESKLSKASALKMIFNETYFPKDSDLSTLQIEVSVLDEEMRESEPSDVISLNAEYGKSYKVIVSGSFENGFSAERE